MPRLHSYTHTIIDTLPVDVIEDGVIYVHPAGEHFYYMCPCGCNGRVSIPMAGDDGWTTEINGGTFSASPSFRDKLCGAHYFLKDGKVEWCSDTAPEILNETFDT